MKTYNIAVLDGDGIGPEVVAGAIAVMEHIAGKNDFNFEFKHYLAGGCAIDEKNDPMPQETIDGCKASDSVLLGAVGGSKWDTLPSHLRPETGLLRIRAELELFANLRPAQLFKQLADACPLKPHLTENGLDILVIRELTGGIYFGEKGRDEITGYDTLKYSDYEIKRIAKIAFEAAMKRNKNLVSVDKANVLESSRVWRKYVEEMAKDYPEVKQTNMYVDNAAMQLVRYPEQFDVIVTGNMFGDILSDEAAMITGSIGMLPSASLGEGKFGLYEPVHGSAPDIAGQGIANPIATIMSVAMMFRYSLDLPEQADQIEKAVEKTLEQGARTKDIAVEGEKVLSTKEMTQRIIENLEE